MSRLARLSWAGRQFVVNEGYWGLQDDMPWTFANIWEVLIMKRMLEHECFAEVFKND